MKINTHAFIQPFVKVLVLILGVAAFHSAAFAGVVTTWTGVSGSSTAWSDPSNWDGGAPISGGTAYFTSASGTTVAFTTGTVNSILFDGLAGSYTLGTAVGSGTLTLLSGATIAQVAATYLTSGTETFNTAINLSGNATLQTGSFANAVNEEMIFNGNITAGATSTLSLNSYGNGYNVSGTAFVINGSLNDGVSRLSLSLNRLGSNSNWVILNGTNNFSGGIAFGVANLQVAHGYSLGNPTASGTLINLGSGNSTVTSYFQYTGTGDNLVGAVVMTSNQTSALVGAIDQSGASGLLNLSGSFYITGANSGYARTLQLQGSTSGTGQYSGVIADGTTGATVSLTKAGAGTWILSGSNTYSGTTSVTGGVLNVQNSSAIGTGTLTLSSGAALQLQGGITLSNVLNLTGSGINNGGALQSISGSNTYSGAITLAGISRINSDAGTLYLTSVGLSMGSNTLILGGSGSMVVGSVLSGSGGLTKDGAGTVTLTNANPLTGLITLSSGTLSIGDGTAGHDGSIASSSGISLVNPLSSLVYNLSDTATRTYSNAIIGQGSLTVAGPGTLTLAGINTFTGATLVTSGSLILSNTAAIGFSPINDSSIANGISLTLSGGVATIAGITGTGAGNFTSIFSNNSSITTLVLNPGAGVSNSSSSNINDGASGMNLTKSGSGIQILTGSSSYTGATAITGGTLSIGNGTLGNDGSIASSSSIALSNSAALVYNLSGTASRTYSNGISGVGSLTKSGSGTLTLSASNTYSMGTTINSGTLITTATNGLGTGTCTVAAPGVLYINPGTVSGTFANVLAGTGTTYVQAPAGAAGNILTMSANSSGYTGVIDLLAGTSSNGRFQINTSMPSATIRIENGTTLYQSGGWNGLVQIMGAGSSEGYGALRAGGTVSGTVQLLGPASIGNNTGTTTYAALITGTGGLTLVAKPFTALITGSDNYTGSTTIGSASSLQIGDGTAGHDGSIETTSAIVDNSALIYNLSSIATRTYAALISGSGTLNKSGAGSLTLSSSNSFTGGTFLNGGILNYGNVKALGTGTATFSASSTLQAGVSGTVGNKVVINSGGTATVDSQANAVTLSAIISGSGGLAKNGLGSLTLTASNSYTGSTSVNAGSLVVSGSLSSTSVVAVSTGANLSVFGLVSAPIALSGTLQGNGVVNGAVTANTGAVVSAGVIGTGVLTASSLVLNNGATIQFNLSSDGSGNNPGIGYGQLALGNLDTNLLSSGTITIALKTFSGGVAGGLGVFDPNVNHTWANIITYTTQTGPITDPQYTIDASGFGPTPSGTFDLVDNGGSYSLNYLAIPEPNSLLILACGAVILLLIQRGRSPSTRETNAQFRRAALPFG